MDNDKHSAIPKMSDKQMERVIENSWRSIGKAVSAQSLRRMFLGAKSSLLLGESRLDKVTRIKMLVIYRSIEKKLLGEILSLPCEEEFLEANLRANRQAQAMSTPSHDIPE